MKEPNQVPATGVLGIAASVLACDQQDPTGERPTGQAQTTDVLPTSRAEQIAQKLGVPLPQLFAGRSADDCDLLLGQFCVEDPSPEGHVVTVADVFRALSLTPTIGGPDDPWSFSIGRMKPNAEGGYHQDSWAAKPVTMTPRRAVGYLQACRGIGSKHHADCIYAAHFAEKSDTHATNCLISQAILNDFDTKRCPLKGSIVSAIESPEQAKALIRTLEGLGLHYLFTTSSHGKLGICLASILWLAFPLPYNLASRVGKKLREKVFAKALDVDLLETDWDGESRTDKGAPHRFATRGKALDPVCERPVQVRLAVKHANEALASMAEDRFRTELPPFNAFDLLTEILDDLRAEREARRQQRRIQEQTREAMGITDTALTFDVDQASRASWAERRLAKHGPAVGGNGGDHHTYLACQIGHRAGLTMDEFWPLLSGWNSGCAPPWNDHQLRRKLTSTYRHTKVPFGSGPRPPGQTIFGTLGITLEDVEPVAEPTEHTESTSFAEFDLEEHHIRGTYYRTVNQRYLDPIPSFDALRYQTIIIKSPYGTGKNVSLIPAIAGLTQEEAVAVLNPRRSLVRAAAGIWKIQSHLDSDEELLLGSVVACVHSVGRLANGRYKALIIDESEAVAQALFHGPLRNRHATAEIIQILRNLVQNSGVVIYQDAEADRVTALLARELAGTLGDAAKGARSELFITNTYRPPRKEKVHIWHDEDGWIEELLKGIDDPENTNIWVSCTSKEAVKMLEEIIRKMFPHEEVLAVHLGTSSDPEVRACLFDPDRFKRHRIVLASPTAGTGISIRDVNLWKVYGHGQSLAGPTAKDFGQQMHRIRDPKNVPQIWLGGHAPRRTHDETEILERKLRHNEETVADLKNLGVPWDPRHKADGEIVIDPIYKHLVVIDAACEADRNRWGGPFQNVIRRDDAGDILEVIQGSYIRLLEEQDVEVVFVGAIASDPDAAKAARKAAKKSVEEIRREALKAAPVKTLEVAEKEALSPSPPLGAEITREAAGIRDFYDLYDTDALTDELILRDDHARRRETLRHFERLEALYRGDEQAVQAPDKRTLRSETTLYLRHLGRQAKLARRILMDFGIRSGLEADTRAGTTITPPSPSWLTWALCREVNDTFGWAWNPTMTLGRCFRSVLEWAGVETDTDTQRSGKKIFKLRKMRLSTIEQLLQDGLKIRRMMCPPAVQTWDPVDSKSLLEGILDAELGNSQPAVVEEGS